MLTRLTVDDSRWTTFVDARPDATPFHHPAWTALLAETYGFSPFALALTTSDGGVVAGLPVTEVRGLLRGRRWVSLPFTDYCPPLGLDAVPEPEFAAELEASRRAASAQRIDVHAPLDGERVYRSTKAVRHVLPLTKDVDALFRSFSRSQVQRNIRRGEREGVRVRRATSEEELAAVYFELHVRTRARLGVPVQPRRFFRLIWRRIVDPGLGFVLLAYAARIPVAGAVFLAWNRTVVYKYGASDARAWGLRPNHVLFWEAIRWAAEQRYRELDFGLTHLPQTGLRDFKASWGATEETAVYSTLADQPPTTSPERVQTLLGPVLRRSPPWVGRALGELLYKYGA